MGVGMPQSLLLEEFGALVTDAFGHHPYHVGSSVLGKDWRDVDVRLILDDAEYASLGLGTPNQPHSNARWVALCRAFSALGKEVTGLPIDFQIQQQSLANEEDKGLRSALGVRTYLRWQKKFADSERPTPAEKRSRLPAVPLRDDAVGNDPSDDGWG